MIAASSEPLPGRRFLALWFPFLPTDRLRRSSSCAAPDKPLLLVAKAGNAVRVHAACQGAQALGLQPGLALAEARARVPEVAVQAADPKADARLLTWLAGRAGRWSPMVALDPPDGLLIDISGCAHLFGGEAGMAADAVARLGRYADVRHAFASTPAAAHALARAPQQDLDEDNAVRRLPVAALRLDRQADIALRRAGLKRIGDLADRPTGPVTARFGAAATLALDQLLGRADSRIVPLRPAPAIHLARRFEEPIGLVDSIRAALDGLTREAAAELERRAQGGRSFAASLFRTDGLCRELAIETGQPTRDPLLVARLFYERIETLADPLDPGFGFDLIRLAVGAVEPLAPTQPDLDAAARAPEALEALIARVAVRHGRARICRLVPVDSHVPERAGRCVPALDLGQPSPWPAPATGEPPLRPIFLFDPPQPVEAIAEVPDAPPRRFRWRGVRHDIVLAEGPERIASPWWTKGGAGRPTRDYYRVEDSEGRRFWLFRQGLHGRETAHPRWYVHGLFA